MGLINKLSFWQLNKSGIQFEYSTHNQIILLQCQNKIQIQEVVLEIRDRIRIQTIQVQLEILQVGEEEIHQKENNIRSCLNGRQLFFCFRS